MKLLIALLFINTAYAQHVLTIDRSGSGYASSQIEKETKELACEKLIKVVEKRKWLKGSWDLIELGSECSRAKQNDETTIVEDVAEFLGFTGELEYYHPENFSIIYEDKTQEIADKEAKRVERKAKRLALKGTSLKKKSGESVGEWRDRVAVALDELLKDVSEE